MPVPQSAARVLPRRVLAIAGIVAVAGLGWWLVRAPRAAAPASPAAASTPPPEPRLGAQATLSSAVVQAMVSGNAAMARGSASDLAEARTAFEQAVALDERYAPAHAALAHALVLLADAGAERPGTVLPKAVEQGDLAVELDPAGALGWHALARAEVMWTRDWSRADMHFRRAIALDPGAEAPAAHLAELLAAVGRGKEAVEQSATALERSPKSPLLLSSAGVVLYLTGDYRAALERFSAALAAGARESQLTPWMVRSHAALGATSDALEAARKVIAAGGPPWLAGYVHAIAGRRGEAEEVLAAMGARGARTYVPALEFAYIRAGLGQREEALSFVETAVGEHSRGSEWLLVDPIFANLRSEARFQAALAAMKLGTAR